jgi:glycosyltransferase involved in cell wall biosynthesis
MIYNQTYKDFEIILVDNSSADFTLEIAREYGISKICNIENYTPGKALNIGIQKSIGKNIVLLSAHCVPFDAKWLEKLVSGLELEDDVFATYGRQIPLPDSKPNNARDLFSVFRPESRIQKTDSFFHNANSAIKKSAWEDIPFDENTLNLEDQIWARSHLELGNKKIFYNSEAKVYHHDGLHFSQSEERTNGVFTVLKELQNTNVDIVPTFADTRIEKWVSIVIFDETRNQQHLQQCIENYQNFLIMINQILVGNKNILVSSKNFFIELKKHLDVKSYNSLRLIERDSSNHNLSVTQDILAVLKEAALLSPQIYGHYPEAIFYYNPQYKPSNKLNFFNNLITQFNSGDFDLVMLGRAIDQITWVRQSNGEYISTDFTLEPNKKRSEILETFLGAGCVLSPNALIRTEILKSINIRILDVKNYVKKFE